MQDDLYQYTGNELELFMAAKNWKQYVAKLIKPHISGSVLEAGAGIGTNTLLFHNGSVSSWVLLEPDNNFCNILHTKISGKTFPANCSVINGYLQNLPATEKYDTIIYIDVMEHIEDDKAEMATALKYLKPGGKLIVLSPAHQYLMSPFDHAIGHYRRYSKKTMMALTGSQLVPLKFIYVDSVGLLASLANKFILKQQYPTEKQIAFWDSWMVPVSKIIDRILFFEAGKTVIGIWKKT